MPDIKSSVKSVVGFWAKIPVKIIYSLPQGRRLIDDYFSCQMDEYERIEKMYLSLLKYPKKAEDMKFAEKTEIQGKVAIVLQGPLVVEENFTLETVKMYRKIYPETVLIISTWRGEDEQTLREIERIDGCYLVINQLPNYSGILNLNYQIISTMAGIRKAEQLGKEYVFKTRCDYRFIHQGLMDYLVNLCEHFPPDKSVIYQKYRIVCGGGVYDSMYRAYWLDDRYCFGFIEDMLAYWNYDLDQINLTRADMSRILVKTRPSWQERTEKRLGAEPNIVRNYIKRMEQTTEPECSIKKYWEILKKQFITLQLGEVNGFWFKYDRWDASSRWSVWRREDSEKKCLCYNWDFAKWLALYSGTLVYEDRFEDFQKEQSTVKG